MEPTIWHRFIIFIKESYVSRFKESFAGVCMGFGIGQHLLFSGVFAELVTGWWWLIKAVGSILIAFITSLATSFASVLVKRWTDPEKKSPEEKRKNNKAA